ncbi:HTH domain-containing protein [Ureibacillus chungkukjangi]|uniref:HTH domain-containing protein n=1 Tax=Ureibacillus chungkukjangi TaxID=1202712 RepID=UPI00203AD0DE|nr:HTH domain-containing protein [Ureibacillus chungkukjangi]
MKDYEMSLYSFGLISGLDEKKILSFIDFSDELDDLSHERKLHIGVMIALLSEGMTQVIADERVKAIIEILNEKFEISSKTLALYAKIEEREIDEFMVECDSLSFEKRYHLAVVVLFLFKLFSDNIQKV